MLTVLKLTVNVYLGPAFIKGNKTRHDYEALSRQFLLFYGSY